MQSVLDDDTFIPDDDVPEEWLAQVFDVAGEESQIVRTRHAGPMGQIPATGGQLERRS
jgi:hypothetical protein